MGTFLMLCGHTDRVSPPRSFAAIPIGAGASSRRFAARVPGPGLWPGPRRQARWVGRGSSAQGWVLKIVSAKRLETIFGVPLTPEGADPDSARRSAARACDILPAAGALGVTLTACP